MKEVSIGNLEFYNEIEIGDLQLDIKNIYPELEKISVKSKQNEQLIKPTKYGFSEITVEPLDIKLQSKEAEPSTEVQEITADNNYNGLSKVTVNKIPDEYIIPDGSVDIIANGTYDVTDKVTANVNVPEKQLGTKTITANGLYKATDDNLDGYSEVNVETSGVDINDYFVSEADSTVKQYLGNTFIKQIPLIDISNLTSAWYMFNKFSSLVTIPLLDTSNVTDMRCMFFECSSLQTIPLLNTSKVTDMNQMFYKCSSLQTIPLLDTSNVIALNSAFYGCSSLQTIPSLNTNNVKYVSSIFYGCSSLQNIPELNLPKIVSLDSAFGGCSSLQQVHLTTTPTLTDLNSTFSNCTVLQQVYISDTSKVKKMSSTFYKCSQLTTINKLNASSTTTLQGMFSNCSKLKNFGGLEDVGQAYLTSASANTYDYKFDLSYCSQLTHESLMNVINNLYDIKTAGVKTQRLIIGSTNLAKLTAEEINIAVEKGFSVS